MRAELYGCSGKNAIAPLILLVSWCWYAHGIGHRASINLRDPGTVRRQGREERRTFSSTSGRNPGYRHSQHHVQTVKRMVFPDWAKKKNALCYCAQSVNSISWVLLQFQNEACLWNLFVWRKHTQGLFVACPLKKQISFLRRLRNNKLWRLAGILGFNLVTFRQSFKYVLCYASL